MTEPAIEGTAHDDTPDAEPEARDELALVAQPPAGIISADQPEEILTKAQQIAAPLASLIEQAGLSKNLGGNRKHVEVGGWQAAGAMLGALGGQALHAETVWTRPIPHEDGPPSWEACVEVRTAAGVVVGRAEAMCGRDERTWKKRDDYAVRSMAETRAESRAYRRAIGWIVHLAGYNPTPAEEMGHEPGAAPDPWWVKPASDQRKVEALDAAAVLTGDRGIARALLKSMAGQLGVMPDVIPATLKAVASAAGSSPRDVTEPDNSDPDPQPDGETGEQGTLT